jgi:hypothetical protein
MCGRYGRWSRRQRTGTNYSFNITVDAGPTDGPGEKLRSGNIQIHQ